MKRVLVFFILFSMCAGLAFSQLQENTNVKGDFFGSAGMLLGFGNKGGLLLDAGFGYRSSSNKWAIGIDVGFGVLYGLMDERIAYEEERYGSTRTDYVELNVMPLEGTLGVLFQYYLPFVGFSAGAGFAANNVSTSKSLSIDNMFVPYIRLEAFYPLLLSSGNLMEFGLGFDYVFWHTDKPVDLPPGYRVNIVFRYIWNSIF